MKVKLLTMRVGPGLRQYAGEVIDLPDGEALRLVKAGQAEQIEAESAVREQPEKAVKRRSRPKRTE